MLRYYFQESFNPSKRRAKPNFGEVRFFRLAPFLTALLILHTFSAGTSQAQPKPNSLPIDVLHYRVSLEPDIANKAIKG